MIKNVDVDKYKYSGYGIGFDSIGIFSHPSGGDGRNVIIFRADMSSSVHANNKLNNVLVLGNCNSKMYSPNFTVDNKRFYLNLHYNGDNSYLFVNGKEIDKFKAKDSEIVPYQLCLGLSKHFQVGYMRASGLIGNVYDFSVDCGAFAVDDIKNIHKNLMKTNGIV